MTSYDWPLAKSIPISVVYGIVRDFGSDPGGYNPSGGHTGIDFAAPIGTPVRAPGDGVIAFEGWVTGHYTANAWWLSDTSGIAAVLDCGEEEPTFIFGHLSRTIVSYGQRVRKGDIIGYTGNTSSIPGGVGAHLHFEALPPRYVMNGHPTYGRVNPSRYCSGYWNGGVVEPSGGTVDLAKTGPIYGIDVSMHQRGINIKNTGAKWVSIKATEGIGYADPAYAANVASARDAGIPVYHYHFARPTAENNPVVEAEWFVKTVRGRMAPGDGAVLDWEAENQHNTAWAKKWLDTVRDRLGVDTWIYMNTSTANAHAWDAVKAEYELWQADYGRNVERSFGVTRQRPATPGWTVAAWQYSSVGRLPGYSGDLDLNIIYRTEGNMATTEGDAKTIAHFLLINPAWTDGPQVSEVLKAIYEGLYVGGESTPDGLSMMTVLRLLMEKTLDPVAIAAALPPEMAKQVASEIGKRLQGELK